jgi:hypothetical protein
MSESGNGNGKAWYDKDEFEKLAALEGKPVITIAMWDKSLVYLDENVPPAEQEFVDVDLYLADHVLLELFAASIYNDLDAPPLRGRGVIESALNLLALKGAVITEVFPDSEDLPVVVVTGQSGETLWLAPSDWEIDSWDELP